ncbi:MAG TPA: F0F1 ATP synthase subunit epsilon [Bryobacteraceae bacterium]|nr:F0F1 ATP synthase subunit epsilon [Bryobacteraceae bacterium]
MQIRVFVPACVFLEKDNVSRVVAETPHGSFGILPHRLDCVAALAPGILTFETESAGETFIAVDEGILVKTGPEVRISVRNAMGGANLGQLRETVDREFLTLDERAKSVRIVLAKLESDFARRLLELSRHG